ncbi:hypothetical protein [Streptomyces sp. NPDC093223]|uniref:hypothetical protein n=1 Tax=Streptomyces sp. NPDC093223 TaxID=3366033 RepID=UPI003824838F
MSPRRKGRTADGGGTTPGTHAPALPPEDDGVAVGDQVGHTAKPAATPRTRVPFGSYMAPDLQRIYKARCVLLGIEMQDALDEAIRAWLDKNPVDLN